MTFSNTKKILIAGVAMMAFAAAQDPPAAQPKPFKDGEQPIASAASASTDPKGRLEQLDKWRHDFPETAYAQERLGLYYKSYGELKMFHEYAQAAQELRKTMNVPDNLELLRAMLSVQQLKSASAEDQALANEAAHYIVDHADQVFAPDKAKAAGYTDDQWKQLKPQMLAYANLQIDAIAEAKGIDAVLELLKQDPSRVQLNGWLGAAYIKQATADPTKIVLALFHYARVAEYDGPNAATAANRTSSRKYFDKQYFGYHGSMEGADQVLAIAKANAVPPPGFDIESITSISAKKIKEDEEKRKANPMITLWTDTKAALSADAAALDAIKGAEMPNAQTPGVTKFKGKIISMTPAIKPKKLVLAVEKDGVADCTLVFEAALPGKMDVGGEIEFSGVVKDVAKAPYMLTFDVDKENLIGWTGKNAPAARPPAKPAAKKAN